MMTAGKLDKRMELYSYEQTAPDEGFGAEYAWTLKAVIWGSILRPRFAQGTMNGSPQAVAITQGVTIRPRTDVQKGWRVKLAGAMYEVIHLDASQPRELTLTLQAAEVQA